MLYSLLQGGRSPLADQFKRWKLWQNWEEVVGPSIAKHTLPVAYNKRVLYVWVKSSSMMQEFIFIRDAVKDKINSYVGGQWIVGVSFTLDKKSVPSQDEVGKDFKSFIKKY